MKSLLVAIFAAAGASASTVRSSHRRLIASQPDEAKAYTAFMARRCPSSAPSSPPSKGYAPARRPVRLSSLVRALRPSPMATVADALSPTSHCCPAPPEQPHPRPGRRVRGPRRVGPSMRAAIFAWWQARTTCSPVPRPGGAQGLPTPSCTARGPGRRAALQRPLPASMRRMARCERSSPRRRAHRDEDGGHGPSTPRPRSSSSSTPRSPARPGPTSPPPAAATSCRPWYMSPPTGSRPIPTAGRATGTGCSASSTASRTSSTAGPPRKPASSPTRSRSTRSPPRPSTTPSPLAATTPSTSPARPRPLGCRAAGRPAVTRSSTAASRRSRTAPRGSVRASSTSPTPSRRDGAGRPWPAPTRWYLDIALDQLGPFRPSRRLGRHRAQVDGLYLSGRARARRAASPAHRDGPRPRPCWPHTNLNR